jgi:hypothetical protein
MDSAGSHAGNGRAHGFGDPLVGTSEPSLPGSAALLPK